MQQLHNRADNARKSARSAKKKRVKASKQTVNDVQYTASATEKSQEAENVPAKKTDKKMQDKPYNDVLAFPETGKVSLFKKKATKSRCLLV